MADRQLTVTIVGDSRSAINAIKGVERAAGGMSGTLRRAGEVAAGFLAANVIQRGAAALSDFVGGSTQAASDLSESVNAVNQIFEDSAGDILEWGEANATAFGLSARAFNQLATPLGAMLKNSGLAMEDVEQHTIDLTKRAADMASVFNTDVEDALSAIQAGLRGEIDPLERYGVRLSAAAIQQRALADTGKESASALTEQEKAAARVALIFEQTASVAGDFAATSDGLANSQRIAAARTEELQAEIGNHLVPVMLKVTELKLALVEVIATKVVPAIAQASEWINTNLVPALSALFAFIGDNVVPRLAELGERVRVEFQKFTTYYESDIKPALDNIMRAVDLVVQFWQDRWPLILDVVRPVIEQVAATVEFYVSLVTASLDVVIKLLKGDFSGAWEAAEKQAERTVEFIVETLENAVEILRGVLQFYADLGRDIVLAIAQGIRDNRGAVLEALNFVVNPAGAIGGEIGSRLGGLIPGRAAGGPVEAGRAYLVGERGPELFVSRSGGHIVPNGGMGGVVNNIYITEPLGTPDAIADAVAGALERLRRTGRF